MNPVKRTWTMVSREHLHTLLDLILIFHDLSNGESELNGNYSLTCPRCNHSGVYKAGALAT